MYELAIKTNNLTIKRANLTNRIPPVVKAITDNYSRGVAKYINQSKKYKLSFDISNGFTKMWEMLSSVHLLSNQKDKDLNVFFIAEAPGQWIYSIDYYIKKKLLVPTLSSRSPRHISVGERKRERKRVCVCACVCGG